MRLILGGPGTGKTTRLLDIMAEEIERGTPPDRIAFVSFTKKAAHEARERAVEKFGLDHDDLPFFRTLHSLSYAQSGSSRSEVMNDAALKEFGELVGVAFSRVVSDCVLAVGSDGDKALQVMSYAHATRSSLFEAWHATGEAIEWFTLEYLAKSYEHYKQDTNRVDFSDMLDRYVANCDPLDVDTVIIDEAQDLSTSLWRVADHMFANARSKIVAGDDMQSIFQWAGADVGRFLSLTDEPEVLPISYRLSREVFDLANDIAARVAHKYEKDWRPSDHDGSVEHASYNEALDYSSGSWMILARSAYFLKEFKDRVRYEGYAFATNKGSSVDEDEVKAILAYEHLRKGGDVGASMLKFISEFMGHNRLRKLPGGDRMYTALDVHRDHGFDIEGTPWFDALLTIGDEQRQYYQAILRNGDKLTGKPRIYIGTIHSVKGGEADNVALLTDITYRTRCGMDVRPDDEHRVFYTAITRTKKHLHIVDPATPEFYRV